MADENQTVDTPEVGPLSVLPSGKGTTIAGQKGVNLGAEQSASIRNRLMQMIAEREGYGGSWKQIGDLGALAAAPIGGYSAAYDQYAARGRQREKDLLELQMGVGQLDTEQERLKQKAAQDAMFFKNLGFQLPGQQQQRPQGGAQAQPQGGALPAAPQGAAPQGGALPSAPQGTPQVTPQGGGLPAAPQGASTGRDLTQAQKIALYQLYQVNPAKAQEEYLKLTNPTDMEKELIAAGVPPHIRAQIMAGKHISPLVGESMKTNPETGYKMPTTALQETQTFLNPKPSQPTPAAAVTRPTEASGTVPGPAAAPSAAVVNPTVSPNIGAGDGGAGKINVTNPHPVGSPEYVEFRKKQGEKQLEVQGTSVMEESKVLAKARGDEQLNLDSAASAAGDDLLRSSRIKQNVTKFPDIVNKLNDDTVASMLMNIADKGIQTPYGSINIPSVNEVATQLAGSMQGLTKEQRDARMSAAQQVARDFATLALRASNLAKGQGAVSDNERRLFAQIAGDYTRLTPQNVKYVAKAIEIEAHNAKERKNLWANMKGKGASWEQYKDSPQYQRLLEQQYYRSAKALGINDPAPFNPSTEKRAGSSANGRRAEAQSMFSK